MERFYLCSLIRRCQYSPNLIYKLSIIPIKIPAGHVWDIKQVNSKIYKEVGELGKCLKNTFREKKSWTTYITRCHKTSHEARVIETVWYWLRDRCLN